MESGPIIVDIAKGQAGGGQLLWQEAYRRVASRRARTVGNSLKDIEKSLSYLHLPLKVKEPPPRGKLKIVNKLESFEDIKSLKRHLFALIIINRIIQHTWHMLFTQNS